MDPKDVKTEKATKFSVVSNKLAISRFEMLSSATKLIHFNAMTIVEEGWFWTLLDSVSALMSKLSLT